MTNASKVDHPRAVRAPLSHDQIVALAGRIDDARLAAIEACGATLEELEEAVAWARGQDDVMGRSKLPFTERVAELYDILTADEYYDDDRD
jgi:hypothetical protein